MDIRAATDWSRLIDWLDSDITAYTIKNAIGFVVVWSLAQGWFRTAAREAQAPTGAASARAIASVIAPGCALARRIAAINDADKGRRSGCPCATANANIAGRYSTCANRSA